MSIVVKIKTLPHAENLDLPAKATSLSSGYDLYAAVEEEVVIPPSQIALIPTGISLEIPRGYEAQVRPRSGLAIKHGITLLNSPGTIDADYRGEIKVIVINLGKENFIVRRGDRIAQMVFMRVEEVEFKKVDSLTGTSRGNKGFGSTGI